MTSRRRRSSMEVSAHDGDHKAVMEMIQSVSPPSYERTCDQHIAY